MTATAFLAVLPDPKERGRIHPRRGRGGERRPRLLARHDRRPRPGAYEVACKPGQTGDGIRTQLTVTGDAAATRSSAATVAGRELVLTIDGPDLLTDSDGQSATVGETIEFVVTNSATADRVLEVKRPNGSVAGEIEIAPNAEGELVIDTDAAGSWMLIIEGGPVETTTDFPVE